VLTLTVLLSAAGQAEKAEMVRVGLLVACGPVAVTNKPSCLNKPPILKRSVVRRYEPPNGGRY